MILLTSQICHHVSVLIKPSVTGIDIPIQACQQVLYPLIKKAWGITSDTDFNFYGRAYRNQSDGGYTPEVYNGAGEYKEVYFDDTLKASAFFGVQENQVYKPGMMAKVFIIFMVNVAEISGTTATKNDEEIRNAVVKLFGAPRMGFDMTGLKTGIDNVFSEYSGWRKGKGIEYRDEFPLHCFRIDFDVLYDIFSC